MRMIHFVLVAPNKQISGRGGKGEKVVRNDRARGVTQSAASGMAHLSQDAHYAITPKTSRDAIRGARHV